MKTSASKGTVRLMDSTLVSTFLEDLGKEMEDDNVRIIIYHMMRCSLVCPNVFPLLGVPLHAAADGDPQ